MDDEHVSSAATSAMLAKGCRTMGRRARDVIASSILSVGGAPGQQVEGVLEEGGKGLEAIRDPFRAAGQVDDEARPPRAHDPPGERGQRGLLQALARISSARPGASRSSTSRVASGVTSRGPRPVPPVVTTRR